MFARVRKRQREELDSVKDKLTERNFSTEYQADWLAIYEFLRDLEQVKPYLDKLEAALQYEAQDKKHVLSEMQNGKLKFRDSKQYPYKRHKIFSNFIIQWAKQNGFAQYAKYIGLQTRVEFLAMIKAKTFFKDSSITVDISHGTWSHAIQWYCIFEHYKATRFLSRDPMRVYQSFGANEQWFVDIMNFTAWDLILDRFETDRNFVSPLHLMMLLSQRTNLMRWPLLCGTVIRKEQKMKDIGYINYVDVLSDKHEAPKMGRIVTKFAKG